MADHTIYQENKQIILRNLVICDELYGVFNDFKILPLSAIDKVKALSTRTEKAEFIYTYLITRNVRVVTFCDALQKAGHTFLADHLQSEKLQMSQYGTILSRKDVEETFDEIPALIYQKDGQDRIFEYLHRMMKQYQSEVTWVLHTGDKLTSIYEKQAQLDDQLKHKDSFSKKLDIISELQSELQEKNVLNDAARRAAKETTEYYMEMDAKHKNILYKAIEENIASELPLKTLAKEIENQENCVQHMNNQMQPFLQAVKEKTGKSSDDDLALVHEKEKLLTSFDKGIYSLKRVIDILSGLEGAQTDYDELCEEADYVLTQIGRQKTVTSLRDNVKLFVSDTQSEMIKLQKQIYREMREKELFIMNENDLKDQIRNFKEIAVQNKVMTQRIQEQMTRISELENIVSSLCETQSNEKVASEIIQDVKDAARDVVTAKYEAKQRALVAARRQSTREERTRRISQVPEVTVTKETKAKQKKKEKVVPSSKESPDALFNISRVDKGMEESPWTEAAKAKKSIYMSKKPTAAYDTGDEIDMENILPTILEEEPAPEWKSAYARENSRGSRMVVQQPDSTKSVEAAASTETQKQQLNTGYQFGKTSSIKSTAIDRGISGPNPVKGRSSPEAVSTRADEKKKTSEATGQDKKHETKPHHRAKLSGETVNDVIAEKTNGKELGSMKGIPQKKSDDKSAGLKNNPANFERVLDLNPELAAQDDDSIPDVKEWWDQLDRKDSSSIIKSERNVFELLSKADRLVRDNPDLVRRCLLDNYLSTLSNLPLYLTVENEDGTLQRKVVEIKIIGGMANFLRYGDVSGLEGLSEESLSHLLNIRHVADQYILEDLISLIIQTTNTPPSVKAFPSTRVSAKVFNDLLRNKCFDIFDTSRSMKEDLFTAYVADTADVGYVRSQLLPLLESETSISEMKSAEEFVKANPAILKNILGSQYMKTLCGVPVQLTLTRGDGPYLQVNCRLPHTTTIEQFIDTGQIPGLEMEFLLVLKDLRKVIDKFILESLEAQNGVVPYENGQQLLPNYTVTEEQYNSLLQNGCLDVLLFEEEVDRSVLKELRLIGQMEHVKKELQPFFERDKGILPKHMGKHFVDIATKICFNVNLLSASTVVSTESIRLVATESLRKYLDTGNLPPNVDGRSREILRLMVRAIEKYGLEEVHAYTSGGDTSSFETPSRKMPTIAITREEMINLMEYGLVDKSTTEEVGIFNKFNFISYLKNFVNPDVIGKVVDSSFEPEVQVLRKHFKNNLGELVENVVFTGDMNKNSSVADVGIVQLKNDEVVQSFLKTGQMYDVSVQTSSILKQLINMACRHILAVIQTQVAGGVSTYDLSLPIPVNFSLPAYQELLNHKCVTADKNTVKTNVHIFDGSLLEGRDLSSIIEDYEIAKRSKKSKLGSVFKRANRRYQKLLTKLMYKVEIANEGGSSSSDEFELVDNDMMKDFLRWGHAQGLDSQTKLLLENLIESTDRYIDRSVEEGKSEDTGERPLHTIRLNNLDYRKLIKLGLVRVRHYRQQEAGTQPSNPAPAQGHNTWLEALGSKPRKDLALEGFAFSPGLSNHQLTPDMSNRHTRPADMIARMFSQRPRGTSQEKQSPSRQLLHTSAKPGTLDELRGVELRDDAGNSMYVHVELLITMPSGGLRTEIMRVENPLQIQSICRNCSTGNDGVSVIAKTLEKITQAVSVTLDKRRLGSYQNEYPPVKLLLEEYHRLKAAIEGGILPVLSSMHHKGDSNDVKVEDGSQAQDDYEHYDIQKSSMYQQSLKNSARTALDVAIVDKYDIKELTEEVRSEKHKHRHLETE